MLAISFIIAIIALFISILAYRRAGGARESIPSHQPWNPSQAAQEEN